MASADAGDGMTYEERIDAIARDASLSREEKRSALAALADQKIAAQDVSHTKGGTYEYKAPPPVDTSPRAQYGSPNMIPTSRSRSARLGSQLGTIAGKFGNGFLEGYEGKRNADEVADRSHAAILETQRTSARQGAQDQADATERDAPARPLSYSYPHAGDEAPVTSTRPQGYVYGDAPAQAPVPPRTPPDVPQTTTQPDTTPPEIEMYGDDRDREASARSDRRSKTSVSKAGAREMLRKAPAYSYEYKREEQGPLAPPGRRYGVMAQDLEKTPMGKSFVENDPKTGRKTVNYGQGLGAMMAGLSSLADDVEKIKGKRKGGSK